MQVYELVTGMRNYGAYTEMVEDAAGKWVRRTEADRLEKALRNNQDTLAQIRTAGSIEYAKQLAKEQQTENDKTLAA